MTWPELIAVLLGTGAAGSLRGWWTGRGKQRADAAAVITDDDAAIAAELRAELERLGAELTEAREEATAARLAAESAQHQAAQLRRELAAACAEIGRLRQDLAAAIHPHGGNQ